MFTKLLAILLVMLLTAVALLVMRHQHLRLASEKITMEESIERKQTDLWQVRSIIAQQTQLEQVRGQLTDMDEDWQPIPDQPTDAPLTDLPHPLKSPATAENAADADARP